MWSQQPELSEPIINNEGFQLITSVCNQSMTVPSNNPSIVWESKAGRRLHGFLAEFRIPLDSINTNGSSWFSSLFPSSSFRRPQPGDIIGFSVGVGDEEDGGLSYLPCVRQWLPFLNRRQHPIASAQISPPLAGD